MSELVDALSPADDNDDNDEVHGTYYHYRIKQKSIFLPVYNSFRGTGPSRYDLQPKDAIRQKHTAHCQAD